MPPLARSSRPTTWPPRTVPGRCGRAVSPRPCSARNAPARDGGDQSSRPGRVPTETDSTPSLTRIARRLGAGARQMPKSTSLSSGDFDSDDFLGSADFLASPGFFTARGLGRALASLADERLADERLAAEASSRTD